MLYHRQKELLYLISRLGTAGKTQLQKLEFLACHGVDNAPYSFFPYRFGPYSMILQKDLDYLEMNGLLDTDKDMYQCSSNLAVQIDRGRIATLERIVSSYGNYSATNLMKHVYIRYPEYAINSEKAEGLLTDHELDAVFSKLPDMHTPHLFTIGYEGRSIDGYLDLLVKNGIKRLIDVRANGTSMKAEFNAKRLSGYCSLVGIEYLHKPELGILSEKRKEYQSKTLLFVDYKKELATSKARYLLGLIDDVLSGNRTALTCFESNSSECHRHILAEAVLDRIPSSFILTHL